MRKLKNPFKSLRVLFSDRIWTLDPTGYSPGFVRLVKFVKLVRITVNSFAENRMGFQCVALSYFVMMAAVPFFAFIFVVSGGFGLSDKLAGVLYTLVPNYPELIDMIMEKAVNIISIAKGGGVGLVSALIFFWAVLWMMFQVERVFNNVWGIRKIPRNIFKRFGFYLLVLILAPFIILLFGTGIAYYTNLPNLLGLDLTNMRVIVKLLGIVIFYFVTVFTLSAMYKFIPAAKVKYSCALRAGFFAGLVFLIFQYLYLETQVFVARMNAVYGVIAAVPLFLIWLNFSWQIIIFGAQLSYGFQNLNTYGTDSWEPTYNSLKQGDNA